MKDTIPNEKIFWEVRAMACLISGMIFIGFFICFKNMFCLILAAIFCTVMELCWNYKTVNKKLNAEPDGTLRRRKK